MVARRIKESVEHVAQFAYVVEKMKKIPEGAGTMLDNTLLVMGSGISDGDVHDYNNLQVLMAGRAGGRMAPKGHVRYDGDRPLADLWLTLLGKYGVDAARFADSTGVLKKLG